MCSLAVCPEGGRGRRSETRPSWASGGGEAPWLGAGGRPGSPWRGGAWARPGSPSRHLHSRRGAWVPTCYLLSQALGTSPPAGGIAAWPASRRTGCATLAVPTPDWVSAGYTLDAQEVYWRLTLDALPTAARLHHVDPCICGEPSPNWFHQFWSCPVAAGLLAVLSNHLESRGMLPTLLLPLHVLLAQPPSSRPPSSRLHVGVWRVVCLAAICALDHVRRTACAIALAGVPSQAASAPASELTMPNRAVTRFWDVLTDFCALNTAPLSWQHSVAVAHPFIAWCDSWKVVRSLP